MKKISKKSNSRSMVDLIKVRSTFDSGCIAQNSTLCTGRFSFSAQLESHISNVRTSKVLTTAEKGIILLLLQEGLRVSEVLSISHASFLGAGKLRIKGSKNSFNRIVQSFEYYDALFRVCQGCSRLSDVFNRFYVYRLCRNLGIVHRSVCNTKNSVTHAGRHLTALTIKESTSDKSEISRVLGHKSLKSIDSYLAPGP